MAETNQRVLRDHAILRKAKRGAIVAGIAVFVVMLSLSVGIRTWQYRAIGPEAVWMLLRFDLLIILSFAAGGALIGAGMGAILALQGTKPETHGESEGHPLD